MIELYELIGLNATVNIYTCLSCFEKLSIILSQLYYDHAPYQESRSVIMS